MSERKGAVLPSIDALRAGHPSCHGDSRETSPGLDTLAAEHGCFTNAISASSHTREVIPAPLTGRGPGLFAMQGHHLVAESIASNLDDAGYETAGFHSNPYVPRADGFDEGFDVCDDDMALGRSAVLTDRPVPGDERSHIRRFATSSGSVCSKRNAKTGDIVDERADDIGESGRSVRR